MKALIFISTIIISTVLNTACNCNGVDKIEHTYAYEIDIEWDIDTIDIYNNVANQEVSLRLSPQSRTEDGDRKCHLKNLVVGTGEEVKREDTKVYCTRALKFRERTIDANTNLLAEGSPIIINQTGNIVLPKLLSPNFEQGVYIFYVEGTSTYGNSFMDSTSVVYN